MGAAPMDEKSKTFPTRAKGELIGKVTYFFREVFHLYHERWTYFSHVSRVWLPKSGHHMPLDKK
jgi:hypothetical protein